MGLKRGLLSLISTIKELLERKIALRSRKPRIRPTGSVTPKTWHHLSAKVDINFADKWRSLGQFSSFADSGHWVYFQFFNCLYHALSYCWRRFTELFDKNRNILNITLDTSLLYFNSMKTVQRYRNKMKSIIKLNYLVMMIFSQYQFFDQSATTNTISRLFLAKLYIHEAHPVGKVPWGRLQK
jgi:hypothetical protein